MSSQPVTVVTGASGQDGTYLCRSLLAAGQQVLGVVRPGSTAVLVTGVERIESDIALPGAMEALVRDHRPATFFNLAAESFSPACRERPVAVCNLMARAVIELLEAVRGHHPQTRVFQASSSEMFGMANQVPQNEYTGLAPETIYGIAKAFAHRACGIYRREGLFVATGILFAHESPLRRPEFLTKKVCRAAARIAAGLQHELVLGDLEAKRDWSFAGDVAEGMRLTLAAPVADDFVFASGELHTVREFCALAFARAGLDYQAHVRSDPALVRRDSRTIVGDPRRAREILGWRATLGFTDLVKMLVDAEVVALGSVGQRGGSSPA